MLDGVFDVCDNCFEMVDFNSDIDDDDDVDVVDKDDSDDDEGSDFVIVVLGMYDVDDFLNGFNVVEVDDKIEMWVWEGKDCE